MSNSTPASSSYGSLHSTHENASVDASQRSNEDETTPLVIAKIVNDGDDVPTSEMVPGPIGSATIVSETINISKNLIGSGVLSLSGGIALYSDNPNAMWSASFWIVILGAVFGYFCIVIAKVCQMTGSTTYRGCWEATFGRKGARFVAIVQMLLAAQGDVAYATVLSQTFRSLLESVGIYWGRVTCLLVITVFPILPLCLMKDLNNLAPYSAVGVAGIGVTVAAMIVRLIDGSYQEGGKYFEDTAVKHRPNFGDDNRSMSVLILPFVCMVFQSWVMHYNSPRFFMELKDATIPRFTKAVSYSFSLCAAFYIVIAAAGYWTFGSGSASYILNNYSPNDPLATISRLCVAFSTLLTHPLAFFGARDGSLDILGVSEQWKTPTNMNIFTVILLSILTAIAVIFHDLGLINAVGGGCLATLLCFVFPAVMFHQAVAQSPYKTKNQEYEVALALVLMVIGIFLGAVGVYESLLQASD
mmetsp:Transcript_3009/g.8484  ORF Transcript_3009/g.8484 Transcript_3009/m.8484 type:complete len:472 (+) Transcript_3009:308-1723(+)|eukprot:CAMPEP_0119566322 /NCGR_PEP_ID=MMETSP1352-20130426/32704_1 /TAXON_ID=265584 /ORGANISM="Stauroneis constricta, Strain CCMP1120" /LENGTH=471 /DNA_ID=CAMNT_0007615403 /DNA_START=96 /DNA_END=1511 /DNA_ORIENTATION=+